MGVGSVRNEASERTGSVVRHLFVSAGSVAGRHPGFAVCTGPLPAPLMRSGPPRSGPLRICSRMNVGLPICAPGAELSVIALHYLWYGDGSAAGL
jgi:hypothetical protein